MDEISQEPRGHLRLPPGPVRLPPGPRRWLAIAGAVGVVAAVTVFGVTRAGGHHGASQPGVPSATASPGRESVVAASPAPTPVLGVPGLGVPGVAPVLSVVPAPGTPVSSRAAAPGTALLTCDSVVWGQPDPSWKAGSLRVGTLWLLDGRGLGYARLGRAPQASGASSGHNGSSRDVEMLVHVDAGSAVVMRVAAGSWPSFQFLNSPGTTGDYQGLDGARGFTFVPCPAAAAGPAGMTDFYDVGFSILPGHTASVEVWTSSSARPVWLTFTAPGGAA